MAQGAESSAVETGLSLRLYLGLALVREERQRPFRAGVAPRGRRREQLDPQPDFVFYGGDLAQLGAVKQLELGAQILKNLKAPLKIMVGEHDWYLDLGQKWQELFGKPTYSFDHKGVHFVVLNSVVETRLLDRPEACRPWSG